MSIDYRQGHSGIGYSNVKNCKETGKHHLPNSCLGFHGVHGFKVFLTTTTEFYKKTGGHKVLHKSVTYSVTIFDISM